MAADRVPAGAETAPLTAEAATQATPATANEGSAGAPATTDDVEASPAASPDASPAASPIAAGTVTNEGVDIGWVVDGQRSGPGQPITVGVPRGATISLPNAGVTLHNFTVDPLGISVDLPVGQTVAATIPADAAPGEYEYYCNVPGHKQAGMAGTLVVQ